MAIHDSIGDFITAIRNASNARKTKYTTSFSKMRKAILEILKQEGFIQDFTEGVTDLNHKSLTIHFKYVQSEPAIKGIVRKSKPGCRLYFPYTDIPKVLGGLGFAILTTSKGLMHDKDARRQKLGGELIATIW